MVSARTILVGPLRVEILGDDALVSLVPLAEAVPGPPDLRLELDVAREPTAAPHGFDASGRLAFADGTLRADRRFERISGTCTADPRALRRALRFSTQPLLLRKGIAMLHAASVWQAGRTVLLAGESGVGKSTLARRLVVAGWEPFCDEVTLVSHEAVSWAAPVQDGYAGSTVGRPIREVHFLERGASAPPAPLGRAAFVAGLLRCGMMYEEGPEAADLALEVATAVAARISGFRTCVPDSDAAAGLFTRDRG